MNKTQEKFFYHKLYKNKIIILKIGGTELASPELKIAIQQIKKLAKKNIKFIIVFGGGAQIDREWSRKNKKPRPKKDGLGVTTKEVLAQAVVPAYDKIIKSIEKEFTKDVYFFNKESVVCKYKNKPKFGEVGKIINLKIPSKLPAISVIGFVGKLKINNQYANINADEIVLALLKRIKNIIEIIFLTSKGCVLDKEGNRVSVMTKNTLTKVIQDKHKNIKAECGMLQKLKEIQKLLPQIPKIAITNLGSLAQEIETSKGSGTLILNTSHYAIERIKIIEKPIITNILKACKKDNTTLNWSGKELKEILNNHYLLKIQNSPLGGFSFFENKDIVVKALWSDYIGNGLIEAMIKYLKKQAKEKNKALYIHSRNQEINKILIDNKVKTSCHPGGSEERATDRI